MKIIPIPILKDNYVWTVIHPEQQTAFVVDPGEAAPVSEYLRKNKLKLKGILLTHHHWDHTNGTEGLAQEFHVPVYGPAKDNIPNLTMPVQENDPVTVDQVPPELRVMEIPGHTLGHIAYYAPGILFCGDTLFAAGCGRIFEGTPDQMYTSIQKIADLPDDTNIYCGHEYTFNNLRFAALVEPDNEQITARMKQVTELRNQNLPSLPTSLLEEKQTNPFLRCHETAVIKNVEKSADQTLSNPVAVFAWLRRWKDGFK